MSSTDTDLKETDYPEADTNPNACKLECTRRPECSAVEWFVTVVDGSRCKLILTEEPATKGSSGNRFRDAICYIRPGTSYYTC